MTRSAARIRKSSLSSADHSDLQFGKVHAADRACPAFAFIFMEACMQCAHTSVLLMLVMELDTATKRFLAYM